MGSNYQFIILWIMHLVCLWKTLPISKTQRFSSIFFPECLTVLSFTLKTMIHFDLTFVYSVRYTSKFIFLYMDVQSLQHHLLKILSFLHCTNFAHLLKISCSCIDLFLFIYFATFTLISHYFDYSNFRINLEIW